MPPQEELVKIYDNRATSNNFIEVIYCSSTKPLILNAISIYFGERSVRAPPKNVGFMVRAIRTFLTGDFELIAP